MMINCYGVKAIGWTTDEKKEVKKHRNPEKSKKTAIIKGKKG